MSRLFVVSLAAVLMISPFVPTALAQEAGFDPIAGTYSYVQPDSTSDAGEGTSQPKFGELISFAIHTLDNGSVIMQMKFADLASVTGELRYCVFFTVGETTYQTGLRGRFVNGAPDGAVTPCTWSGEGTSVGMGTLIAASDQVHMIVPTHQVPELVAGATMTDISVHIGAVVPVAAQGDPDLFDTLTPSVEPVDFTYGAAGPAPTVDLLVESANLTASASPGETVEFAATVHNPGAAAADVAMTVDGLPEGFNATIDPENSSVAANTTLNVTLSIAIPEDAELGTVPFSLNVTSGASTFLLPLEIVIDEASASPSSSAAQTPATGAAGSTNSTNETGSVKSAEGEGVPAPGFVALGAAIAVCVAIARRRRA